MKLKMLAAAAALALAAGTAYAASNLMDCCRAGADCCEKGMDCCDEK